MNLSGLSQDGINCSITIQEDITEVVTSDDFDIDSIIPLNLQMYVSLWYMASHETFSTISNHLGITLQNTYKIVGKVFKWIIKFRLPNKIKWPNLAERSIIKRSFQNVKGITNVVGSLGCYHIRIPEPTNLQSDFFNRRKFHSVRLQIVVDHRKKFLDVTIGDPGSMSDSKVLKESSLATNLNNDYTNLMDADAILLGGVIYPSCYRWLVTPYRNIRHLTIQQQSFNYIHAVTRSTVDDTFSILTDRFLKLKSITVNNQNFVKWCVMTACYLHNFCIDREDEWPLPVPEYVIKHRDHRREQLFQQLVREGKLH